MRCAFKYLGPLFVFWLLATNLAAAGTHPLAPPDTSSPRATLQSFQGTMGEMARLLREDIHLNNIKMLQNTFEYQNTGSHKYDSTAFSVEHYHDTFGNMVSGTTNIEMPTYSGSDVLNFTTTALDGLTLHLGPNSNGEEENS